MRFLRWLRRRRSGLSFGPGACLYRPGTDQVYVKGDKLIVKYGDNPVRYVYLDIARESAGQWVQSQDEPA